LPPVNHKRWIIPQPLGPEAVAALQAYHPVLRQLLYNRGYTTAEQAQRFLEARTPSEAQPENLAGMSQAVERIRLAIGRGEQMAVYGDYDADGVTATALLVQALRRLGAQVVGYIPNRFDEGYGLNMDALALLYEQGVRLVITVDCGIRSAVEAEAAHSMGLDMIITDHHHPLDGMPPALAVINPKQDGDAYPDKNLAGVGLAYKLAQALLPAGEADDYLDLVALGTVADLAPLTGENRALVRAGLELIRQPVRQGVMALLGAAGLEPRRVTAGDIGYMLGPRLNAAGRLDSALAALELLTTVDVAKAARLAQQLDVQNRERQQITRQIQEQADKLALQDDPQALLLFAAHEGFNPGVVGLAASRLVEMYYRPAIIAHRGEQFTRGSCRSIPEFHITAALDECAGLMEHHGGHAAAAGFTVRNERLPELLARLREIAARELSDLDLRPTFRADMEIPLRELKPELLKYLDWLQPTGNSNPPAMFVSRGLRVVHSRAVGSDQAHLKLSVSDGAITYDAIGFRLGRWKDELPARVDLLYSFEINEYNGRVSLQLNIRDLKPSEA
jgi:single-stranded-DNA-specific exonuclease